MLFAGLEEGVAFLVAAFVFGDPILGELARLNVLARGGQKSRAGLKWKIGFCAGAKTENPRLEIRNKSAMVKKPVCEKGRRRAVCQISSL